MALSSIIDRNFSFMKIDVDGPEAIILRDLPPILQRFSVGNIIAEITISIWDQHFGISDNEAVAILDQYYDLGYYLYLTHLSSLNDSEEAKNLVVIPQRRLMSNITFIPRQKLKEILFMKRKFTKNIFFGLGKAWSPSQ